MIWVFNHRYEKAMRQKTLKLTRKLGRQWHDSTLSGSASPAISGDLRGTHYERVVFVAGGLRSRTEGPLFFYMCAGLTRSAVCLTAVAAGLGSGLWTCFVFLFSQSRRVCWGLSCSICCFEGACYSSN